MKTNHKIYKTLYIDITTYKTTCKRNPTDKSMDSSLDNYRNQQNKFICSICLNQKHVRDVKGHELTERKSRSCPICQCSCSYSTDDDSTLTKRSKLSKINFSDDNNGKITRNVQTSLADVNQGLSLLNEVLNVFQSKKQLSPPKEKLSKTLICKDVGISTDDIVYRSVKPKLTKSNIFHCSIEGNSSTENKFTIVNSTQPENIVVSHKSLDLMHKSSSIPQMKLEELKKSLKTKTQSKDAIKEANRMFATVKRVGEKDSNDNRPMIRSGPRVLPVVKTGNFEPNNDVTPDEMSKIRQTCKPCQEKNYYMSSGDSSNKNKCCHSCNKCKEGNNDCVYTMCCHYQKPREPTKELLCKRCRMGK